MRTLFNKFTPDCVYDIKASYLEIYKEKVLDLIYPTS